MVKLKQFSMAIATASLSLLSIAIVGPARAVSFTLDFETAPDGTSLDANAIDGGGQSGFSTSVGNVGASHLTSVASYFPPSSYQKSVLLTMPVVK